METSVEGVRSRDVGNPMQAVDDVAAINELQIIISGTTIP